MFRFCVHPAGLFVLALLLAIWQGAPCFGLDPSKAITQYSASSWQLDDGLPQDTVRDFAQTPDGFLWIGTEAGLARFDGASFDVFDRRSHPEIFASSHVYALAATDSGDLWIGTYGGGLVRYVEGEFQRVELGSYLPSGRVTGLETAPDGGVWIGTYGGGLIHWQAGVTTVFGAQEGLEHPVIFDLASDGSGGLWLGTYGGGIYHFSEGRFEVTRQVDGLVDDHVWAVLPSRAGGVWVGSNRGLQHLGTEKNRIFTRADGLPHDRVISLLEDDHGNLWFGTYGGGLGRTDGESFESIDAPAHLPSSHVWRLFEDDEGNLWAGTLGGGLVQLKDGPFTTLSLTEGLASELPSSFFEDVDGSLWVASRTAGLDRIRDGRIETLTTADGLSSNNLWGALKDREGALWVATSGAGVDRLQDGVWTHFGVEDGLLGATAFVLYEDPEGDIWLGTNAGANRWRDGRFESFTSDDGLPSDQVRIFFTSRDGRFFVGTSAGLAVLEGDRFRSLPELEGLGIYVIAEDLDHQGRLWIGTVGFGLLRFDGEETVTFTTDQGFFDDQIRVVVEDGLGFLWVAGSRGIARIAKADLNAFASGSDQGGEPSSPGGGTIPFVRYGERDGMKSSSCYGGHPAGIGTRDGRIWFATLDGVTYVEPAELRTAPAPTVVLEEARVDGRAWPDPPILAPGTSTHRFDFTAHTLAIPEKIGLRYRLVGLEEGWRESGEARSARYGPLSPGDYVFEVMASDEGRRWVGEITRFPFTVRPAFHQTTTFYCLCGLAVGLAGFGLHRLRVAHLRQRERELEDKVEEALASSIRLRGLLPICASCKRIRSDEGYWEQLETYIDEHSEAKFSHGLCPGCADDLFTEIETNEENGVATLS